MVLKSGFSSQQPDDLDVAMAFALQPTAGPHAVEIAVDVDFEQDRGVVCRSPRGRGVNTLNPQFAQVKLIDEDLDHLDGIVLADEVIQALGQQRSLGSALTLDETLH